MTSCIKVIIYDHCQKLNILNEEQKGCVKECFGCKEQLIIDTVIMEQVRKNNRNIYTAFIDYKKAYESVPHSWLIKILKIFNSYLRYKCKKLSFIARTGLKYDRGTREYFKRCECNKGTFYTYVLQHFIYDRLIITGFNINLYKIIHWFNIS
jgi:hypothetical protein